MQNDEVQETFLDDNGNPDHATTTRRVVGQLTNLETGESLAVTVAPRGRA